MRFVALSLAAALAGAAGGADYTMEQARSTVEEHVRRTASESEGVYRVPDGEAGTLSLEFVRVSLVAAADLWRVHDPERRIGPGAFYACILFHAAGAPAEKVYDVDMLVEPREGGLAVTDVRVHKEKQLVNGKWVWEPRKASRSGTAAKRP